MASLTSLDVWGASCVGVRGRGDGGGVACVAALKHSDGTHAYAALRVDVLVCGSAGRTVNTMAGGGERR